MNDLVKSTWEYTTGSIWPRHGKFTAGENAVNLESFTEAIVHECLNECHTTMTPWQISTAIMDKFSANKETK